MPISRCQVCGFETADLKPWGKDPEKRNICANCGIKPDQIKTTVSCLLSEDTGINKIASDEEVKDFVRKLILVSMKRGWMTSSN